MLSHVTRTDGRQPSEEAFTLIELLVVITVLATLATVVVLYADGILQRALSLRP